MSNRTAKFVSAIVASFLAGIPLTTTLSGAATADSCAPGPKGQPSAGGHWYYRTDHATKRHCWYIGDEKGKPARVAHHSSASASPVLASGNTPRQNTIADAHAELPPQAQKQPANDAARQPPPPATAANAATMDGPVSSGDTKARTSVVAARWPGSSDVNSAIRPGLVSDNTGAEVQSGSAVAPASADAAVPLAAADIPPQKQSYSVQMLAIVVAGALALAGLMGSAVFRFGGRRRMRRNDARGPRIWASKPTAYGDVDTRPQEADADGSRDDPNRRIVQMLARLSRSAAT